jgi:hypothetical protein
MKILYLLIAIVLLASAMVILFTETEVKILGCASAMSAIGGYLLRMVTEEE